VGIKTLDHNKSTDMKTLAQALNLHFPDHWLLWPRIYWEIWSSAVSSVALFHFSPKQQSRSAGSRFTLLPYTGTYFQAWHTSNLLTHRSREDWDGAHAV